MWRTALAISAAVLIALLSAAHGACQSAQCGIVYYTVTKMYTKVQTIVSVDVVVVNSTTTTTTRTQTITQVTAEPGGVLANFTCTWQPPTSLSAPPVSAPGAPTPQDDFAYLLLTSVAFGAFALAMVYELSRVAIFLVVVTAAIWILAAAYTPLTGLAAGLTALTAAFVLATAFFKR
jgi:hypothetical protein